MTYRICNVIVISVNLLGFAKAKVAFAALLIMLGVEPDFDKLYLRIASNNNDKRKSKKLISSDDNLPDPPH